MEIISMAKTFKRNFHEAVERVSSGKGRIPVIRKTADKDVSHSRHCWSCMKGSKPKKIIRKAIRRSHKEFLKWEIEHYEHLKHHGEHREDFLD